MLDKDPRLLVGYENADDAGVVKLSEDLALIQTVDFFTPIVDDPYEFGQIAAANALSDVYAMGGTPVTAMNIVAFPCSLGMDTLSAILKGGAEKVKEAGALLVGGHSVEDKEPKYGLAVTGIVHPDRVVANSTARPGDMLVLTKPLGTGIISTALKAGAASNSVERESFTVMKTLNRDASSAMVEALAHACTDITGFGLLGHGYEMASGSGVGLEIWSECIPLISGVLELATSGHIPGGLRRNRAYIEPHVEFEPGVPEEMRNIMCDPETSGGLLIAISPSDLEALLSAMDRLNVQTKSVIGRVTGEANRIKVKAR